MLFRSAKAPRQWPIRGGIVLAVLLATSLALIGVRSRGVAFQLCPRLQPPGQRQQSQEQQGSSDPPFVSTVPCTGTKETPSPRQFDLQRQRQQRLAAAGPVGGYLAACAIIKNQHKDLPEWLEYHKWLGVSQFYIMDDGSDPPLDSVLQPYIQQGWVTHRLVGNHTALARRMRKRTCAKYTPRERQISTYNLCLQDYGHLHQWMSFTDPDEFLVLTDGTPDLPTLLRDYESYGGLGANWRIFGSNKHLTRQPSTLRAYTSCLPFDFSKHRAVKMIGNMAYTADVHGPHSIRAAPGHPAVTSSRTEIDDAAAPAADYSRLALLHYQLKSRAEFDEKMERGSALSNKKDDKYWNNMNQLSSAECTEGHQSAVSHGLRLSSVAYILGIALLVIVAMGLVLMACWLRRKDRRHLAALQEARRQADAAEEARREAQAAEAARRLKEMVIPVVILQPDGACWLAEELKRCRGDAPAAGAGCGKGGGYELELAGRRDSGDAMVAAVSVDVVLPIAASPAAVDTPIGFLAPMFAALSPAAGTTDGGTPSSAPAAHEALASPWHLRLRTADEGVARALLQASSNATRPAGPAGPKTVVVVNLNTQGQAVPCVNVTAPFSNATHDASGEEKPEGGAVDALAALICSNYRAAGRQIFDLVKAGDEQALLAAAAAERANCSDANLMPRAITTASVLAQERLGGLRAVEGFFQALARAFQAVGVPACITLVESDPSGTRVAAEKYFATS
ncbi:glycosyltranserase family 2 [Micractinium conductrix]|uniref:Glycosyltranserase family 2 n=1 Tax=Micractinium conductrix TaxID=554055 RepID=A0A2P6VD04_9CHLO|nr:glycosyltranserase family 2 [Micractinium conductrix]|eukprot:PSC71964.1 glycosyltranserase family 2 [Micractinium conductrix]